MRHSLLAYQDVRHCHWLHDYESVESSIGAESLCSYSSAEATTRATRHDQRIRAGPNRPTILRWNWVRMPRGDLMNPSCHTFYHLIITDKRAGG